MGENVRDISDSEFDAEVLKSQLPVLVDFWAPWCGPCKSIASVLDELADQYKGRLKVLKVNIDDNPNLPDRYNIQGIPNLLFFKNGSLVDQVIGAVSKARISEVIDKIV